MRTALAPLFSFPSSMFEDWRILRALAEALNSTGRVTNCTKTTRAKRAAPIFTKGVSPKSSPMSIMGYDMVEPMFATGMAADLKDRGM